MCSGAILEAFEPTTRGSDIFCATAAKCGQTWLLALMHHLRTRGLDPDLGGENLLAVMPWLEQPRDLMAEDRPDYDVDERIAELERLPDPRIFKLHVVWDEIPRAQGSEARIVTITRDPRDLPYSMFKHLEGLSADIRGAFDDDFDMYFEKWMELGYFFELVTSFWPHRDDPDVLWLRYEDLQRDLPTQARKIAGFFGWELEPADYERALPLVGFEHMRATETSVLMRGAVSAPWKEGARFFREGGIGKNRARLSPQQEARIVERAHRELDPACFELVMSIDSK